ncbi:MAG: hypothetical protein M1269_00110 [Chloroflexi bacterium]|nr:hypothetical protein [Chloroflexota bacterium]
MPGSIFLLFRNPNSLEAAKEYLIASGPAVLNLLLAFFILFFVLGIPRIYGELKKISAKSWLVLLLILIMGVWFRLFLAPREPQVYFDEITFLEMAKSIALTGSALINSGGAIPSFLPAPMGWETILSWAFRFFGPAADTAFFLNIAFSSLTIILFFLLGRFLLKSDQGTLFSAFLFAVLPVGLRIAGSSALCPSALFFFLFTLWIYSVQSEQQSMELRFLAFFSMLLLLNIRQEALFFFLPVIFLFVLLFCRRPNFKDPFTYAGMAFFAYFSIPYFLAVWYGLVAGFYYFYEPVQQIKLHVRQNYYGNLLFFVQNKIHPVLITILAVIGGWFFRKEKKPLVFMLAWFIYGYLFYSANPSCDLSQLHTWDSWRIALFFISPVLFLGGYGISVLAGSRSLIIKAAAVLLAVYLLLIPWSFSSFIFGQNHYSRFYNSMKIFSRITGKAPLIFAYGDTPYATRYNLALIARWAIPSSRVHVASDDPGSLLSITGKRPVYMVAQGALPGEYYRHFKIKIIKEHVIIQGQKLNRLYLLEPVE